MATTYKLKRGQGFFDVVIEAHGNIEGAFDLLEENNFDGFTDQLFEAETLLVAAPSQTPRVKEYLAPYMPVATVDKDDMSDGIGWMIIDKTFIVR